MKNHCLMLTLSCFVAFTMNKKWERPQKGQVNSMWGQNVYCGARAYSLKVRPSQAVIGVKH